MEAGLPPEAERWVVPPLDRHSHLDIFTTKLVSTPKWWFWNNLIEAFPSTYRSLLFPRFESRSMGGVPSFRLLRNTLLDEYALLFGQEASFCGGSTQPLVEDVWFKKGNAYSRRSLPLSRSVPCPISFVGNCSKKASTGTRHSLPRPYQPIEHFHEPCDERSAKHVSCAPPHLRQARRKTSVTLR